MLSKQNPYYRESFIERLSEYFFLFIPSICVMSFWNGLDNNGQVITNWKYCCIGSRKIIWTRYFCFSREKIMLKGSNCLFYKDIILPWGAFLRCSACCVTEMQWKANRARWCIEKWQLRSNAKVMGQTEMKTDWETTSHLSQLLLFLPLCMRGWTNKPQSCRSTKAVLYPPATSELGSMTAKLL